jgi:hypothetical protein
MKGRYPKTEQELAERFEAGEDLESLGFDVSDAKVEKPSSFFAQRVAFTAQRQNYELKYGARRDGGK